MTLPKLSTIVIRVASGNRSAAGTSLNFCKSIGVCSAPVIFPAASNKGIARTEIQPLLIGPKTIGPTTKLCWRYTILNHSMSPTNRGLLPLCGSDEHTR